MLTSLLVDGSWFDWYALGSNKVFIHVIRSMSFKCLIEYIFFSLKIINPKNIDKNILEISDQNCIKTEVTLLYFSTNQLKTRNKNILGNSAQKLIYRKIFRLHNK